jgi:hypothetical protein
MMKGITDGGVVVLGLTQEDVGHLLLGRVRVALAATDGAVTAPAVRVFYAPTYEELAARMQEQESKARQMPASDASATPRPSPGGAPHA